MIRVAVITGCAGFIGINLTKQLLKDGWYVYGIDKLTYAANQDMLHLLRQDYRDRFHVEFKDITEISWLPESDFIFNLAAESDVDRSNSNCANFVHTNIKGTQNLLDIVVKSSYIKASKPIFVQISTDEVYGDLTFGSFSESATINPSNPYAATKASADLLVQSYSRTHGIDYIIVRPSNNYGEFQYPEKLIPLTIKKLKTGKKIKLHNNGTPVRSWTHVSDTIEAIKLICEVGSMNTIYNISSGFEQANLLTVKKIINAYFNKETDVKPYIDVSYSRPGQDVRYSISCEPLYTLGWAPKVQFDTEIKTLVTKYDRFVW
jgi:dTDP-glucose 4,6-dehydratase